MITYLEAIKRPFKNPLRIFLGSFLLFIPVLNFLIFGYFLKCAKTAFKKDYILPDFKSTFMKGFVFFIFSLIFGIPVYITAAFGSIFLDLFPSVSIIIFYYFLLLVIAILTAYLVPAVLVNYAIKGELFTAFAGIGLAFKRDYFIKILLAYIYTIFLHLFFLAISFIIALTGASMELLTILIVYFVGISFFLSKTTLFTLLGDVYRKAEKE